MQETASGCVSLFGAKVLALAFLNWFLVSKSENGAETHQLSSAQRKHSTLLLHLPLSYPRVSDEERAIQRIKSNIEM